MAAAWLPNLLGLPEVHHKDGNGWNNAVSNLEWVDRATNAQRWADSPRRVGQTAVWQCCPQCGAHLALHKSAASAARGFGVGVDCKASSIKQNGTSCGYRWARADA